VDGSTSARRRADQLSATQVEVVELGRDLTWIGLTVSVCIPERDMGNLVDRERSYECPVGCIDLPEVLAHDVEDSEWRVCDKGKVFTV